MSTFIDFTPSTSAVFNFQPTLGGNQYNIFVPWNIFGQRFYISVRDLAGNLILYRALAPTGPTLQASFLWTPPSTAIAVTTLPHNVPIGSIANILVSQTDSEFDGAVQGLATTPTTLTYTLNGNPEESIALAGVVDFPLNLVGGFITGGLLLFHEDTQQFEFS